MDCQSMAGRVPAVLVSLGGVIAITGQPRTSWAVSRTLGTRDAYV